jgi:ATP synthase protein I
MANFLSSAPVRITLRWQVIATLVIAIIAWFWVGIDGAISAALGGSITVVAGMAYAIVITVRGSRGRGAGAIGDAGPALITMFTAEGVKIGAIILMLWAVITQYRDLVAASFFAAFVVTVLLNRVAFLVSDQDAAEADKN